jgi:hypothetical protein
MKSSNLPVVSPLGKKHQVEEDDDITSQFSKDDEGKWRIL